MDTLALYYNTNLFNAHGITAPPRTWEEFNDVVKRTTVVGSEGAILQAGATLGASNNVEYADDILEMFMLQNGAQLVDFAQRKATFAQVKVTQEGESFFPGENALTYYTNFADPSKETYTWSRRMGDAKTSFTNGQAVMYIGYAQDLPSIRESGVSFNVAPLPQVKDRTKEPAYIDSTLARYWAGVVSATSQLG